MANYPAPRLIPDGKVLLCEPSHALAHPEDRQIVQTLAEGWAPLPRSTARLRWYSPGWACAGSMMRWENESWGVDWMDNHDGARHGRRFRKDDEAGARAFFARITKAAEAA